MRHAWGGVVVLFLLTSAPVSPAQETKGNGNIGFWLVSNNVTADPRVLPDDGYGGSYLADDYYLLDLGLQLTSKDVFQSQGRTKINTRLSGRGLIRLTDLIAHFFRQCTLSVRIFKGKK